MHILISHRKYIFYLIFLIPLLYFSYAHRTYQLDDALIYQRYIQNLFDGHGLVYNIGERFNGLTSSLYTYLIIIFTFIIGNINDTNIFLATLLTALTLIVFTLNFSKYEKLPIVLFAALLTACTAYFYFVYTMETPLFLFLIGLCIYLFEKEDIFLLGIACTLLVMTRSEGALLILAMAIEHFRLRRPFPKLKYFIIPILLLAANYSFYKLYYGAFLPATASAKIQQGASGFWGEWPHAFLTIKYQLYFFMNNKILAYSLMILPFFGILKLGLKSINVIIVLFLVFYSTFFLYYNIPNYHWYYAPYYLFACFYTVIGLSWFFEKFKQYKSVYLKYTGLAVLSIFSLWLIYTSATISQSIVKGEAGTKTYRHIGEWFNKNTPADAKIALLEIGAVGWYSQRYVIDILGLVNPLNSTFIGQKDVTSWVKLYTPDYFLAHVPIEGFEQGANYLFATGDFYLAKSFSPLKFEVFARKQKLSHPVIFPHSISAPYHTALEGDAAVLMVHAPGTLEFTVPAGQHTLTGKFGILKNAYQENNPYPTDGVEFSAVLIKKNGEKITLFKQFLDPKLNTADRGLQEIPASSFSIEQEAQVVLYTNIGMHNNGQSDQAFWKKIQFN